MALFLLKTTGRAVLRRPNLHTPNIPRRPTSSNTQKKGVDVDPAGSPVPVANTIPAVSIWYRLGPFSKGVQAFARSQKKRPYATQFVTSLCIWVVGDLSAQKLNGDEYNPARTVRALVLSGGSSIPSYKWFMFLNNNFNYSSRILSIATKVIVNQIVFTPIFNTYFFGMQSLLSGDSLPEVWDRIKRTVPISMINSCKLWPAVTAFSFTFIEPQYRSIFAGVIAIGWQTYLGMLNRRAEMQERVERSLGNTLEKLDLETPQTRTQRIEA